MEILRRIYEIIESVRNELMDRKIYKANYIVRKNLRRKNRVQLIRRPLMSRELYMYKSLHSTRAKRTEAILKRGVKRNVRAPRVEEYDFMCEREARAYLSRQI